MSARYPKPERQAHHQKGFGRFAGLLLVLSVVVLLLVLGFISQQSAKDRTPPLPDACKSAVMRAGTYFQMVRIGTPSQNALEQVIKLIFADVVSPSGGLREFPTMEELTTAMAKSALAKAIADPNKRREIRLVTAIIVKLHDIKISRDSINDDYIKTVRTLTAETCINMVTSDKENEQKVPEEFRTKRIEILNELRQLIASEQYDKAGALIFHYTSYVNDDELDALSSALEKSRKDDILRKIKNHLWLREYNEAEALIKQNSLQQDQDFEQVLHELPREIVDGLHSTAGDASNATEVIGEWDDYVGVYWRQHIRILRTGDRYYRVSTFQDGSGGRAELISVAPQNGESMRFKEKENDLGEIYAITGEGDLSLYDAQGFIRKAGRAQ